MGINKNLLPIKGHYFFFMAAMGPILPQLQVYGRELGISAVVMGTVTGILPIMFMLAKPLFGLVIDIYRDHRKFLFMLIIFCTGLFYTLLYFIPTKATHSFKTEENFCDNLTICSYNITHSSYCKTTKQFNCINDVNGKEFLINAMHLDNETEYCTEYDNSTLDCDILSSYSCHEEIEIPIPCLSGKFTFWAFILLMSLGTIGFNVANSVSDAICFDVIGEEFDYGKQRVWGTIGYGITALVAGFIVDFFSDARVIYLPAFIIMIIFILLDLFACSKLDLPVMEVPGNFCSFIKDLVKLLENLHTKIFIIFAVFAGVVDGFIVYFMFWYLEDLGEITNTENIKLIEGLVIAAETLGGEVVFFSIAGSIISRFGHAKCFSMCFIFYALRLALISVVPNPWWIIPIEFCLQGPTYALIYTTIVAYANAIAPPGASATMQGIAAGMDDGFGYAIGSFLGGLCYKYIGKAQTFQLFAAIALVCGLTHVILQECVLKNKKTPQELKMNAEYKSPEDAIRITNGKV